jgi:sRNA-binding carbon storage regulator CsrA
VTDIRRIGTGRPYCKLGIEAPRAVLIRRDELPEVITEGHANAANRDHE